jgi:hypothetical protein
MEVPEDDKSPVVEERKKGSDDLRPNEMRPSRRFVFALAEVG